MISSQDKEVCSIELAKRLKELGVPQKSLYRYAYHENSDKHDKFTLKLTDQSYHINDIAAFTVAELGDRLPNIVTTQDAEPFNNFRIVIRKFYSVDEKRIATNNYRLNYECDSTEVAGENAWLARELTSGIFDSGLANAMAKMCIYLIENGLIKV